MRLFENRLIDDHNLSRAPTPRELLFFVNALVTLKLQWEGRFSLSHLAAYILATQNINILHALQLRQIPKPQMVRLLGASLVDNFAALYFNISDTAKARFLLRQMFTQKMPLGQILLEKMQSMK